jgi:RND family efflux transporter MFP subunit
MSEQQNDALDNRSKVNAGDPLQPQRMQTARRIRIVAFIVLLSLLVCAAAAFLVRHSQAKAAAASSSLQNKQYVLTVRAKQGADGQALALPGTLQGFVEAPISARISGYLLRWNKDIGSRVKKGEILAEISNPEADQQLAQAVAARQQLVSTLDLAKVSLERWKSLRAQHAVSLQEYDERNSAYLHARASLEAADANIRRLKELESFKRVVAPFSGLITHRNANIGDLIETGGSTSRALFSLAQTDPLRVYVYVPQTYAAQIKQGAVATVTQAELPGQSFKGKIVRTAGAIDVASRSLQTEILLPNQDGKLLPGAYVNVSLPVAASDELIVPTNTLLLRSEGPRVGVVDNEGLVHLRPVVIGKDFGLTVQILNGITTDDNLVLNPSDSLAEGDVVIVAKPENGKNN